MTRAVLGIVATLATGASADGPPAVDYARDVKPILAARCYVCHGARKHKGGLRLDTAASILKGGDGGPAVEPGDPEASLLIEVVTAAEGLRMPPEGEGEALPADLVDRLRAWIAAGAPAPAEESPQRDPADHWAFRPPSRPAVPGEGHPIDAFLAAAQRKLGAEPLPETDRATLLRRVSLDLVGLAPTPAEVRAFAADDRADAYERAVDRLLASPAYGERWGRHWMDVWRYSDWAGYGAEVRESRPHIWRWRDWIVESLNDDLGYDQMIVAMLAADEATPGDASALRATGYLARSWYKFNRDSWLQDTVDHTARAFLGLTYGCARCHDHKYDPIEQDDYYRLRAVFEPHDVRAEPVPGQLDPDKDAVPCVYDANPGTPTFRYVRGDPKRPEKDRPLTPGLPAVLGALPETRPVALPVSAYAPGTRESVRAEARSAAAAGAGRDALEARIAADDARVADPTDSRRLGVLAFLARRAERRAAEAAADSALARAEAELAEARKAAGDEDAAKQKVKAAEAKVAEARKAAEAARAAPADRFAYTPLLPFYPAESTGRRLSLARWIASPANPLTARVAVNHVWMRHFGEPLVPTVADFGNRGQPPTHPELLDWLAVEFMEGGWRLKDLHRLIVTSAAYRRRSSAGRDGWPAAQADPANVALWRMNPRRMEAELVRDNVLQAAGALDPATGGPDLDPATALTTVRRSLYYRHAPEKQVLFLRLMDAANPRTCYRRDTSVAPQQALAMINSPLTLAQATALAGKLAERAGDDPAAFVAAAFEAVIGRPPAEAEAAEALGYLAADPGARRAGLVHALFSHHEFITIR